MKLSMNVTTTFYGNVVNDIKVAKEAGYDGVELQSPKLYRYLDQGFAAESVVPMLEGIEVSGIGAVQEAPLDDFRAEAERLAALGQMYGAPSLQMCTGPVDVQVVKDFEAGKLEPGDPRFRGLLGRPEDEVITETAKRVGLAADIAADHGLGLYLEPLGWAPVHTLPQALRILEICDRDNLGLTVDFWHFFVAGDTPEDVAKLDPSIIHAVHVCDGVPVPAGEIPDQGVSRNVMTGGGSIPLQEWVDAVKATGYDGWYASEIFCDKANEFDFLEVAQTLRNLMHILCA
ncbi:sugar phosphate isomerase/epimerase family protein [Acidipropionibacterium virtanenii]|uniref:Inosose isomerase n=1 Tax=Acidipropionibacterium virtanenii TaxID=2057246 RepID=A0A344UYB1_9ACTN|nr:sugar phosphate isomerase/epimerase family protein [Acidipropionibacterium virtanenii]AXE40259.1 Inosose isomerase [Acidipropionibacterium virtanenii]